MSHPLLDIVAIQEGSGAYLGAVGCVFAVFDEHTQDSGNISYGVRIGRERFFVKTAGNPDNPAPFLSHSERVSLLRNSIQLQRSCSHRALPRLRHVIESPDGPALVYPWMDGDLIRSSLHRFRQLPVPEVTRALDVIYEAHHELSQAGWIAVDFYDGCLLYDFPDAALHLVDLDHYHQGPFTNTMGRMFGSRRFMSPEEFELGATIDERSNVYTMGRTAAVLLSDGTVERPPFRGSGPMHDVVRRACSSDRARRFDSMASFYAAWQIARPGKVNR
jgi:serine/threonine-protein kinase